MSSFYNFSLSQRQTLSMEAAAAEDYSASSSQESELKSHHHHHHHKKKRKKNKIIDHNPVAAGNNKRFSEEQIKSLESIFKVENKLEQKKKQQVATQLGLQPRQVAIWFQNKRARWKSKQLEIQYNELKSNYDSLSIKFESLKREKQSLLTRVKELRNSLNGGIDSNDGKNKMKEGEIRADEEKEQSLGNNYEQGITKYFRIGDEYEKLKLGVEAGNSMVSIETWCNLGSSNLFDHNQSCGTSNWWENV